jgi:hypothetical protein
LLKYRPWVRKGFLNDSPLTETELYACWTQAQLNLADGTALDTEEERKHFRDSGKQIAALKAKPRAVKIKVVDDITYEELVKVCAELNLPVTSTGDPTGKFQREKHFVAGVTDYPLFGPPFVVKYVRSRPDVLIHEFQHVILKKI